jgi:hypothetical protein
VFASTFKSEKSFEVSSASLRNSVVSRVARLQNSNPTTMKKIILGRIVESDDTEELYSRWMCNSTAMHRRVDIATRDMQRQRARERERMSIVVGTKKARFVVAR